MPNSFEAVGVVVLAVLPGALYVWGFERIVGNWGISLSDRVLRFIGTSALVHALLAPATYWLWANFLRGGVLSKGEPLPWGLWLVVVAFVGLPFLAGTAVGRGTSQRSAWATIFTGPDPAPRAWDHFFASRPDGWIRLKLKSGPWIGGAFAPDDSGLESYAAGYPESQDLFLARMVEVDPETGQFLIEEGRPVIRDSSLLIRWDEVEFMEFIDA